MNHGGEWCSSCPVCGDGGKGAASNRFRIWPERESGGKAPGRFWCRQCNISGDTIAFLQQVDGLTFAQACAELGLALDSPGYSPGSRYQAPPSLPAEHAPWTPKIYDEPGEVWREKAGNLLIDCQQRLAATPEALAWLAGRGITADIARAYGLGYNLSSRGRDRYRPRDRWGLPVKMQGNKVKRLWIPRGWVIPAYNQAGQLIQLRIRRLNDDIRAFASDIKYLPIDGSSMATMVLHPGAEVFVVVECGFDAILLSALTGGRIGGVTTWNSSARPDAGAHEVLSRSSLILGALDYDQGGDREQDWWRGTYRQYRRLPPLPGGAKDPGDAAAAGVDVRAWLIAGVPAGLRIKLGLTWPVQRPAVPVPAKATHHVEKTDQADTDDQPAVVEVVEVELADGVVVYVTNDQERWQQFTDQGKPVFSQRELERLGSALAGLDGDDRRMAIARSIEAKQVFSGYIRHGRGPMSQVTAGEQ